MAYIWLMDTTNMGNLGSATKGESELVFLIWSASIPLIYSSLVDATVPRSWILPCPVSYSLEFFLPLVEKVSQSNGMASLPTILEFLFYLRSDEFCYCQMI